MDNSFYRCERCGAVLLRLAGEAVPDCCSVPMSLLEPCAVEAVVDRHMPVIDDSRDDMVTVYVSLLDHPMKEEHRIEWVALETQRGMQLHRLRAGEPPVAQFALLPGETALAAYAYCSRHLLWRARPDWACAGRG